MAARRIVAAFREQQRITGDGPYRFQRLTTSIYDNSPNASLGNPTAKMGLLHSAFRPSDDASLFPFLVPSLRSGCRESGRGDQGQGGVTKTLEYSYDGYAVELLAKNLHDQPNYEMLMRRSNNYKNMFDDRRS